jgi:hypothetical protein
MSPVEPKPNKQTESPTTLTDILGAAPILPGESEKSYQQGLQSLIEELEAKTVMQVYLAEKIFECLWWMRRYEQQKRATLTREMAKILNSGTFSQTSFEENQIMEVLLDPTRCNEFEKILKGSVHNEQSLLQLAFANKATSIANLNEQVTVLAKTLAGFQVSYEVLSSRKLNLERLRIQNELLSKDLLAIELETPDAGQS